MEKIISLFCRNYDGDCLVRDEVTPGAEWVPAGEGVATRKWDGTCCLVRSNVLYKRYMLKRGRKAPEHFEPATELDEATGKQEGWVPVGGGPGDKWHREAFGSAHFKMADGTYELLGPKVQGNPESMSAHVLVLHGMSDVDPEPPRTFVDLREFFQGCNIEGVVWHHPDGRMAKIKGCDFGIVRSTKA